MSNPEEEIDSKNESMNPDEKIINNQTTPSGNCDLLILSTVLKSQPVTVECPFCKGVCVTRTERQLSWKSCLFSLLGTPYLWFLTQICRNKDLNCYNAKHYCLKCNAELGEYSAC